jgi:WD40 repeat protein
MMVKKFTMSNDGTLEQDQVEDQGEELYAIALGKSTTEEGKFNLTFAGESGKVENMQLDNNFNISQATKQTLVDFGSQVNTLQWSQDGSYLIVAGADKSALIIDSKTQNSKKCTGIELDSEVVFCSIDGSNDQFSLSLKDGSVVIGQLSEAKLTKKVQVGKMIRGELSLNQTSFSSNGDLMVPGKSQIQKLVKSSDYALETLSGLPSVGKDILGIQNLNDSLVAAFFGNEISIFNISTSKLVKNESTENDIRALTYCEDNDVIYALDTEGNLLTLTNATSEQGGPTQISGTKAADISETELEQIIADEKQNIQNLK